MSKEPTEELAGFISQVSFSDLPEEVVKKSKLWMLDAIGCGLGGSRTPLAKTAVAGLSPYTSGASRVIGRDVAVDAATSAFLNALAINALDYDDSDPSGHPSSTLVGTLLSLCSYQKATGRDLLLSYVTGFEVSSRIGQACAPSAERFADVWGLGTHQTFGAVSAAAKLRQLDKIQTLNAMGIAGASAPVPSGQKWGWDKRPLTWVKDAVALPAQVGVNATAMAKSGFIGCRDILDGDKGFWRMAASDQCDFELMTRNLGSEFFLMNGSIKTYACCWFIHPTLDAVKRIVSDHNLTQEQIASIDVWSLTDLYDYFNFIEPSEMVDAQFSLPYCVALTLLGVETGPDWVINKELFANDQVLSIGDRVKIHPDKTADKIFHSENRRISARVVITTRNGEIFEETAPAPRGTPDFPVSEREIIEKFEKMAVPVLGEQKMIELRDFVLSMESQDAVKPLADLISL